MGSVGPGSGRVAAAGPRTQVRPGVCPDVAGLRMNVNAGFPSAAGFSGARRLLGTTAGGAHPSSRMQLSEEREISAGSVCLNRKKKTRLPATSSTRWLFFLRAPQGRVLAVDWQALASS